jgi:hypothetical protein
MELRTQSKSHPGSHTGVTSAAAADYVSRTGISGSGSGSTVTRSYIFLHCTNPQSLGAAARIRVQQEIPPVIYNHRSAAGASTTTTILRCAHRPQAAAAQDHRHQNQAKPQSTMNNSKSALSSVCVERCRREWSRPNSIALHHYWPFTLFGCSSTFVL